MPKLTKSYPLQRDVFFCLSLNGSYLGLIYMVGIFAANNFKELSQQHDIIFEVVMHG